MRKTGKYEFLNNKGSFIPDPLPPKDPHLNLDAETINLLTQASVELSKLNNKGKK